MTLQELEESVSHLSPERLAEFRDWFLQFDADKWDASFESDAKAGLLDELADNAIADHAAGRSNPL